MKTLYIPPLGAKLVLAADWNFRLFDEYSNAPMISVMKALDVARLRNERVFGKGMLPAGTELTLRTYRIRLGQADADRITFTAKVGKRNYRFWVKLEDANLIQLAEPSPISAA